MTHPIEPNPHQDDWSTRFVQEIEQWFRERYECDGVIHRADPCAQSGITGQVPVQDFAPLICRPR